MDPLSGGSGADGADGADDIVASDVRRFPVLDRLNWHPSRGAAVLGIAGLLAGLAVGYAAGHRQPGAAGSAPLRPPSTPSTPAAPAAPAGAAASAARNLFSLALTQSTAACSVQRGHELQLGVEVTNQSGGQVSLRHVNAVLPLGGLRALSQQWGPCGVLPRSQDPASVYLLAPGASTWLTVTFQVLKRCPGPDPVQFTVVYDWNGQRAAAILPGFSDLTQVPYTGCA